MLLYPLHRGGNRGDHSGTCENLAQNRDFMNASCRHQHGLSTDSVQGPHQVLSQQDLRMAGLQGSLRYHFFCGLPTQDLSVTPSCFPGILRGPLHSTRGPPLRSTLLLARRRGLAGHPAHSRPPKDTCETCEREDEPLSSGQNGAALTDSRIKTGDTEPKWELGKAVPHPHPPAARLCGALSKEGGVLGCHQPGTEGAQRSLLRR